MTGRAWTLAAIGAHGILLVAIVIARPRFSRTAIQVFPDDCFCGEYHEEVTGLIALNPLRNRAPEEAATQFLSNLRNGNCEATIDPTTCHYGLVEARPLLDWKLGNRKDQTNKVSLSYVLKGEGRPGTDIYPHDAWGEGMVEVHRTGTQWRVSNYSVYLLTGRSSPFASLTGGF